MKRPRLRRRRQSQPGLVLATIQGPSRELYAEPPPWKPDLSYISPRRRGVGGKLRRGSMVDQCRGRLKNSTPTPPWEDAGEDAEEGLPGAHKLVSLYSILSRYLGTMTTPSPGERQFTFTDPELSVLEAKGYSHESVSQWAAFLLERKSHAATHNLLNTHSKVPYFVILLFLRRKDIKLSALGILMQHVDTQLRTEHIGWDQLKVLVIRLLRHARVAWPESFPWIATLFIGEMERIWDEAAPKGGLSAARLSDFTHFCNRSLSLMALPASLQPVLSARHQQKAQFEVLRFMNGRLHVTRTGWRATMRTQLAHAKTENERDWAQLKGPSWPPWIRERTAMDEDKGYESGTSRAMTLMHRMQEYGYRMENWEEATRVYAGWDTDLSPTIQTRNLMAPVDTTPRSRARLGRLLWAARVRATRTRGEAWASFLAWEASGAPPSQEVYHAMFEKLHHVEVEGPPDGPKDILGDEHETTDGHLPGDMKEVFPEPKSSMDQVYHNEPVPSYEQLYWRMKGKCVRPTGRVLAFLVETSPEFYMGLEMLQAASADYDGDILRLLDGSHLHERTAQRVPPYLFSAFIRFLCNFGCFTRAPVVLPVVPSPEEHRYRFVQDKFYLIEYAYALLVQLRPLHRPPWTTYMNTLLFSRWDLGLDERNATKLTAQYAVVSKILDTMQEVDIDADEGLFRAICMSLGHAANASLKGVFSVRDARHALSTGPRRIRTMFHELVSADVDQPLVHSSGLSGLPPIVPGPATLHLYVRTLGAFGDYEGIYSFVRWAVANEHGITERVNAQRNGDRMLRRTLVAVRLALEGSLHVKRVSAPEELVVLVQNEISRVPGWGGWPTEDDVASYSYTRKDKASDRHGIC